MSCLLRLLRLILSWSGLVRPTSFPKLAWPPLPWNIHIFTFLSTVRLLGVTLDQELTFTQHINLLCRSCYYNRNRKLEIFTAPTKAKSREPAYSQGLVQNKIDRQRVDSESQADSQTTMVDGVWRWDGEGGRETRMNQDRICWRAVFSVWSERAVERCTLYK